MKKISAILFFGIFICAQSACADLKWTDATAIWDNEAAILKTPPEQISEEQFYVWEEGLIAGSSGSGGSFLSQAQIDWILKMERFYLDKKIKLKDSNNRHGVIANSYFNDGLFEKAMDEYKKIGSQSGFEEAEWHFKNKGLVGGSVVIAEHDGPIKNESSEGARAENESYLFISFFKGPIYRYNKVKNTHAIIYGPNKYEWAEKLELDQSGLKIKLRLNSGVYEFDNEKQTIERVAEKDFVFERGGNIFFKKKSGEETQITTNGKDRKPVLSPDGKTVAFVRKSKKEAFILVGDRDDYLKDGADAVLADQLWAYDINSKSEKVLSGYENEKILGIGEDPTPGVLAAHIDDKSIQFSPDGKTIYFISSAWVTSGALFRVQINDAAKRYFLMDANEVRVIYSGKHEGNIVVQRHKYFMTEGTYDFYFMYSPDGQKEIGVFGENFATDSAQSALGLV